jgi:hypothetical protein
MMKKSTVTSMVKRCEAEHDRLHHDALYAPSRLNSTWLSAAAEQWRVAARLISHAQISTKVAEK